MAREYVLHLVVLTGSDSKRRNRLRKYVKRYAYDHQKEIKELMIKRKDLYIKNGSRYYPYHPYIPYDLKFKDKSGAAVVICWCDEDLYKITKSMYESRIISSTPLFPLNFKGE